MAKLNEHIIRRVLAEAQRTRRAHKLGYADAFIAAVRRGEPLSLARQIAFHETDALWQAYDAASIESQIVRWLMRLGPADDDGEDEDQ